MAKKSSISRQMELMLAALAAIVALSSIALTASAQDVEAQKAAALNDIRETADDICYTVQQQGTQTTIKLSGDIQAKADGGVGQLVEK
jgi:hypothetical protein